MPVSTLSVKVQDHPSPEALHRETVPCVESHSSWKKITDQPIAKGQRWRDIFGTASGGRPIPGDSSTALPTHLPHPTSWEKQRRTNVLQHYAPRKETLPSWWRQDGFTQLGRTCRLTARLAGRDPGWGGRLWVPGQLGGITKLKRRTDGVVSRQQRGHCATRSRAQSDENGEFGWS